MFNDALQFGGITFSFLESAFLILFLLAWLTHVFYALRYFLPSTKVKSFSQGNQQGVSVIVCARNEEENLRELIPAIMEQDYSDFQLIVVNDSSWDETADILKALQLEYPSMHIIHIDEDKQLMQGKKFALTLGIKAAKYEIVLLTDADCRPRSARWIHEMAAGLDEKKEIALGFSGYKKYPGYLNKLIRFDAFVIALNYFGLAKVGLPYMGVGRNLAYTKTAFFRIGGFRAHYKLASGDDDLFVKEAANARNTILKVSPDSQTISEPHKTWSKWSFQKKRHFTTAPLYDGKIKRRLSIWPAMYFVMWFSAIVNEIIFFKLEIVIFLSAALFLRYVVQFIALYVSAKRLKIERDIVWLYPILEKHLIFVQIMLYVHNLVRKPQKWN
jgi:cellulose synthase/poly-beta-1,6-N-acetylglucosamine synthase-like glycosyltransferase